MFGQPCNESRYVIASLSSEKNFEDLCLLFGADDFCTEIKIEDEWQLDPLSLGLSIPHRFSFKIPHLIRTCNKGVVSVRVKILGIKTN